MKQMWRAIWAVWVFGAVPAWAAPSLDAVTVERQGDALVFGLACSEAVATGAVSTKHLSKGAVLEVHLAGVTVKKGWAKLKDPLLKRTLLKSKRGAAVMRTRFKSGLSKAQFAAIKIEAEGTKVWARVPVDDTAAAAWAAPVAAVAPVVVPAVVPVPAAAPAAANVDAVDIAPKAAAADVDAVNIEPKAAAADVDAVNIEPEAPKDTTGSVQAGIQAIADRLAAALEAQDEAGFRRIAVLPFEALDEDVSAHSVERVSSELMSARLARRPRLLQVERARLDAVVGELKRSERGELSPKGAASVGKLLGANSVVVGSVGVAGSDYVVTARAVDAESGQVLAAADQGFEREGMVAFSADAVVVKSRFGAAARSAGLPGWGQIYNGDTGRGVTYLTLFGAVAAGAITSAVLGVQAENDYNDATNSVDAVDAREDADAHYERTNIALIGLGLVWAVAVTDAYLTGTDASTIDVGAAVDGDAAEALLRVRF